MCEPTCVQRYMRLYSWPAQVTVLRLTVTVRVGLSSSTKNRCSRVSLHRDTQGQTAQRGHSTLLSGDKSAVCGNFHRFDCKLKPTDGFKCHNFVPPTSVCIATVREKDQTSQYKAPSFRVLLWFRPYFQSSKDQLSCLSPT